MADDRPPWPGYPPPEFHFPFAEARAAKTAALTFAENIRDFKRAHESARDGITVLEGEAAGHFHRRFGALMERLDSHIIDLDNQADDIQSQITTAEGRLEQYEIARSSYDTRRLAYDNWEPEPAPAN